MINKRVLIFLCANIFSVGYSNCKVKSSKFEVKNIIDIFENSDRCAVYGKSEKTVTVRHTASDFLSEHEDNSFLFKFESSDKVYSLHYYCKTRQILYAYKNILQERFQNLEVKYNGIYYVIILESSAFLIDLISDYIDSKRQFPGLVVRRI